MSCSSVDTVHSSPQVSVFNWRPGCDWDDLGFYIGTSEGNECFWCYGAADVAGRECNA